MFTWLQLVPGTQQAGQQPYYFTYLWVAHEVNEICHLKTD